MSSSRRSLLIILLASSFSSLLSHPQCLDFRAPFQPDTPLTFCSQYDQLGCCSAKSDDRIRSEFEYLRSTSGGDAKWAQCENYVKAILCQTCSPYAAHIYDAETTGQPRTFPGLCSDYCQRFFQNCHYLLPSLDVNVANLSRFSSSRFCNAIALQDVDYCYPSLLSNPLLNENLTVAARTKSTSGCLCLEEVKDRLANPLFGRHAGDGTGRVFVAEQVGRVHIYNSKTNKWKKELFMNFTEKPYASKWRGDERGFLGMAFHPNFSNNGRFFVYYSTFTDWSKPLPKELQGRDFDFSSTVVVSEMTVNTTNPDRANLTSERIVIELPQPYANHNGGEIFFGHDGYLYIFFGDGGGAGDPMKASQNMSLLHGKVVRIDVDSGKPYAIPPDNPFVGQPSVKEEIYAFGVRNIWRCGVDTGDKKTGEGKGRVLCGDVGQSAFEEVDLLKKGANYGWNAREGFACYDVELCGIVAPVEMPVHAYGHSIGKSVTGGVFYRGCQNPALNGHYIYGDYVSRRLFSLKENNGKWVNSEVNLCGNDLCQGHLVNELNEYILSFGEDEAGEIYMLTSKSSSSGKKDGHIYKLVDPLMRGDPNTCGNDVSSDQRVRLPVRNPDHGRSPENRMSIRIRVSKKKRKRARQRQKKRRRRVGDQRRAKKRKARQLSRCQRWLRSTRPNALRRYGRCLWRMKWKNSLRKGIINQ